MEYLFQTKQKIVYHFTVSNQKLYMRHLSESITKFSSVTVVSQIKDIVSIYMDDSEVFHIAFVTISDKLGYIKYNGNNILHTQYIDYNQSLYYIGSVSVACCHDAVLLLFCAVNKQTDKNELFFVDIHGDCEILDILYLDRSHAHISTCFCNHTLYLLCVNHEESYHLRLFSYSIETSEWNLEATICSHSHSIRHFSMCADHEGMLHILYSMEEISGSRLYYVNQYDFQEQKGIPISYYIKDCTLFVYKKTLWLHWNDNNHYHTCFYFNGFSERSQIVPTSLQVNPIYPIMFQHHVPELIGTVFLGSVSQRNIYIGVLEDIIPNLLPSKGPLSNELLLILDTTNNIASSMTSSPSQLNELAEAYEYIEKIEAQYNELHTLANNLQDEARRWKRLYTQLKNPDTSKHHNNEEKLNILRQLPDQFEPYQQ